MKKKHKNKLKIPKLHPSIHVGLAILLFFVCVRLSRSPRMDPWEESIFISIYNWPDILLPFFLIVTLFGSIYVLAILIAILVVKKRFNELIRLLLTAIFAYQLSGFAKDIWGRGRPHDFLVDITTRDYFRGPGFPSGHTALAVAMALVVGHYLPKKYQWVVPVWIIGVGLSRVYLGIHAPLDIVGGFAIGWFSYMLFRHVRLYPVQFGKKHPKKQKLAYNAKK